MKDSRLILVLALLTMVGPLGIDTYLPSFPSIARSFAVSPVVVQQTLSVYLLCMASMMLFYGTLSDSFGRRPVLVVAMGLFTLSSLAALWAPSAGALIAIRGVQGLAAGAGGVVARAMVQDHFKGHDAQRATAVMMMVFGLAPALAPVLGGWLEASLGWRSIFVFLAAFGALMLLMCLRVLPETLPRAQRTPFALGPIAANYARCMRHPRFMLMSLSLAFLFSGVALYIGSAAAFVMGILHQSETAFAWLFVPMIGGMMLGSAVSSRFAHRVAESRLIGLGFALMLVAVAWGVAYTATQVARVPYAVLPIGLYTFGLALAMPGMSVQTLNLFPRMSGLAASLQGFIQMFLFALVSGLVAPLLFDSAFALAAGHAVGVLMGVALWGWAMRVGRPAGAETADNSA